MPTIAESGVKGYEVILWHGLIAPKGLDAKIADWEARTSNQLVVLIVPIALAMPPATRPMPPARKETRAKRNCAGPALKSRR